MKSAVPRIAYPRYLKAVRVTLVSLGFDEEWVDTDFRDALEAQYLEGESWHDQKAIMYRLTFPFLPSRKNSLKTLPVSILSKKELLLPFLT